MTSMIKNICIAVFFSALLSIPTAFASPKAEALLLEYESLKNLTKNLTADGQVGGLLNFKDFTDHQLLWDKNGYDVDQHDTLRIFIESPTRQRLATVTYHYSDYLIEGRTVLRRFIGEENKGWRADTIDVKTLEDLGTQGVKAPRLTSNELKIIKSYSITIFVD